MKSFTLKCLFLLIIAERFNKTSHMGKFDKGDQKKMDHCKKKKRETRWHFAFLLCVAAARDKNKDMFGPQMYTVSLNAAFYEVQI